VRARARRSWQRRSQAPWSGCVRARTSEVVYVDVGRRLLALHGPEVEPFPFSVVLADSVALADLKPGVRVRGEEGTVRLGERSWPAQPAPVARVSQPAADAAALRAAIAATPAVARRRRELGGVLDVALGALRAGSWGEVVRLLVGWGPGLTPSGDDVLVGLAAGHALQPGRWGAGTVTAHAAQAAQTRTTFVSRALLDAAASGRFAPALVALSAADDAAGRAGAIARVAAIGSRSGLDLLVGVGAGLEMAHFG
jgi:hypothetical protein